MKQIIEKIMEIIVAILPFLRKKSAKELKEFSELITNQYEFLMVQLEKVLKDYFDLSDRVKEMHTEIFTLKQELRRAMVEKCSVAECKERI